MINKVRLRGGALVIALFFILQTNLLSTADRHGAAAQQPGKQGGVGNRNNLNSVNHLDPEIKARLEAERLAFFEKTADLRAEIYKKKLAMKDELQKDSPDGQKLKSLQKELSQLQSLLNKERFQFLKRLQAIHPQAGAGYYERGIMGRD